MLKIICLIFSCFPRVASKKEEWTRVNGLERIVNNHYELLGLQNQIVGTTRNGHGAKLLRPIEEI